MGPARIHRSEVVARPRDLVARAWQSPRFAALLEGAGSAWGSPALLGVPGARTDPGDGHPTWIWKGARGDLSLTELTPGTTVMSVELDVPSGAGAAWLAAKSGVLGRVLDAELDAARRALESTPDPAGFASTSDG